MLGGMGRFVSNKLLKFPRGTNRSSYAQLYVAFFLSAIIHFAADLMSQQRAVYHSFRFFLFRPVAITFGDLVIHTAKRVLLQAGIKLIPGRGEEESWAEVATRVVGYSWVISWFYFTLPVWRDKTIAITFDGADKLSISQFMLGAWKRWA